MVGKVLMIPLAIEAGFGGFGTYGSLINPEFGSSFRLAAVMTDAPFATTPKHKFVIDDLCSRCRVCENSCPSFAIEPDKKPYAAPTSSKSTSTSAFHFLQTLPAVRFTLPFVRGRYWASV
ncbi:MAG: hypothetical protein P8M18_06495 [Woeseiaceae bacterium]|nr:hypothetical protein [Woeseiaceae bacterium]